MAGYMYILECSDSSYYTGSTRDLEYRLWQHQNGEGANHTRKHLPVKLVYSEEFERVDDAFYREKQVQGWSRKKKEALIKGEYEKLPGLSRNYGEYGRPASASASASTSSADGKVSDGEKANDETGDKEQSDGETGPAETLP